ncbi:hypothetical protein BJ138DRAFT_605150 [Hygrophoropsis aurantiaca]|uniref:Uncharacterized protein n=1 Tax=Hygrophoropsis aurantiaca TaxID=72124 RepID=A0ACB8AJK8_9AGAM|nr:hypothetical protein BJ138DRAFT_605150 [Hygrophoropsis aurantiaca]
MNSPQDSQGDYVPLLPKDIDLEDDDPNLTPAPSNVHPLLPYLALVASLISVLAAVVLNLNTVSLSTPDPSDPRYVATLRKVTPYPNMELDRMKEVGKLKGAPMVWFPPYIVRANALQPDMAYTNSNTVTLSPTDSMFYHFTMKNPPDSRCYVIAVVPSPSSLANSTKSYSASGNLTGIQVYNISYPALRALQKQGEASTPQNGGFTWNTRPPRQGLLGTVDFKPAMEADEWDVEADGNELRAPTPLFECGGRSSIAFEVACQDCRLEFDQILSMPAMAFDVAVIG